MKYGSLCNLREYGRIVYLFERESLLPSIWDNTLEDQIVKRLRENRFSPDLDFFAASGTMSLSHIALAALVRDYGKVKCLLYDRPTKLYKVKKVGKR